MGKFKLTRPAVQNDLDKRKGDWVKQGDGTVAEREARSSGTDPGASADSEQSTTGAQINVAHLGTHVQSVLSAAERAAVRIQEEAREEAERVREHAKREAAARAETVLHDADVAKAEAERLRSEVAEWSEQARTAAENNASERRSEAETESREILLVAERQAAWLKNEAEQRNHALEVDIALAESRLRELANGLHELADQLDNLLMPSGEEEEGDLAAGSDDSLVDAATPETSNALARVRASAGRRTLGEASIFTGAANDPSSGSARPS
jgi:hypothetical protein